MQEKIPRFSLAISTVCKQGALRKGKWICKGRLSKAVLGGNFGPEKKNLAPPSQNCPQTPSRPPRPPTLLADPIPPLRIFNQKPTTSPSLSPRTPPSPLPNRKNKKYPKRPPRVILSPFKGSCTGIPREQAHLRRSNPPDKKWTSLSLAFYSAPNLRNVDFTLPALQKTFVTFFSWFVCRLSIEKWRGCIGQFSVVSVSQETKHEKSS